MKPKHRLFFALQPPPLERRLIACIRDARDEITSEVANDRLHATMGITGDTDEYPERLAEHMLAIGDAIRAEPINVMLNRLSASSESLALRSARVLPGVGDLARKLQLPMERAGLLRPAWNFDFHLTLGYRKGRPFSARVDPIAWRCTEFVLIHSVVGRTRHIELGRWPLVPRQYDLFD